MTRLTVPGHRLERGKVIQPNRRGWLFWCSCGGRAYLSKAGHGLWARADFADLDVPPAVREMHQWHLAAMKRAVERVAGDAGPDGQARAQEADVAALVIAVSHQRRRLDRLTVRADEADARLDELTGERP